MSTKPKAAPSISLVKRKAPMCLLGSDYYDMAQSIDDVRFAAQHEIDLAEEGESEALPPRSIAACRKFLSWLDGQEATQ